MKNKNIAFTILFLINIALFGQMNHWVMPPYDVNVSVIPCTVNSLYLGAPAPDSYGVANGVYSPAGQLLFYIKNQNVYNGSGAAVGPLGYNLATDHTFLGGEVAIVPIPGECSKYYVIYSMGNLVTGRAMYIKVDCSGGSPVITYANNTIQYNSNFPGGAYQAFILGSGPINMGLAVSKFIQSSNGYYSPGMHYLYICSTGYISSYKITDTGISAASSINIPGLTSVNEFYTTELELSDDGKWLAWTNSNNNLYVIQLSTPTTYLAGSLQTYGFFSFIGGAVRGLEFQGKGPVPDLYVAGGTSASPLFSMLDLTLHVDYLLGSGGYPLTNTFLEQGSNGQIYGISDMDGKRYLVGFDIASLGVHAVSIKDNNSKHGNLNSLPYLHQIYTLPDQIDGQNYSNFNGFQNTTLTGLTINNTPVTTNCGQTVQELSLCNPMLMTASYKDGTEPCSYRVEIQPLDADCNPLALTPSVFYYGLGEQVGVGDYFPPVYNLDMKDFVHQGLSLANSPGYYKVTLKTFDCCNNQSSSITAYIHVTGHPAPVISLKMVDTQGLSQPVSHNVSVNPGGSNMGAWSVGFNVTSGGYPTNMHVEVVSVNASTGAPSGPNFIDQDISVNPSTLPSYANLNSFCVDGSFWNYGTPSNPICWVINNGVNIFGHTDWFSYHNSNSLPVRTNRNYKLTVTLSSECGSSSSWSYFHIDDPAHRPAVTTGIGEALSADESGITVYPNPAAGEFNVKFMSEQKGDITVNVYDVTGKLVKSVTNNTAHSAGQIININTADLTQGIYSYRISSGNSNKSGLISISK